MTAPASQFAVRGYHGPASATPPGFLANLPSRAGTVRRACEQCSKSKRDDALSVTRQPDGSIVWLCHRCGDRGAWRAETFARHHTPAKPTRPSQPEPDLSQQERHNKTMRAILDGCRSITPDDAAGRYLASRGLPIPEGAVFFHPRLRHREGQHWPGMVAVVTDAPTNEPMTLHRTYLTPEGRKAPVTPRRAILAGGRKKGGVIRLSHDADIGLGLGLAEGIETALSAIARGWSPVWATIDASNLAAFPVLPGVEALTAFVDHDPAGTAAFSSVAERWLKAGREVLHMLPPEGDLNDFIKGH